MSFKIAPPTVFSLRPLEEGIRILSLALNLPGPAALSRCRRNARELFV
jgi:hypothetical protein